VAEGHRDNRDQGRERDLSLGGKDADQAREREDCSDLGVTGGKAATGTVVRTKPAVLRDGLDWGEAWSPTLGFRWAWARAVARVVAFSLDC
jgi:hypothetical protein